MLYLDNAATTHLHDEVLQEMIDSIKDYGNTEAKYYSVAENAKKRVEKARQQVSALVNAKPSEVVFTSGATEANNLILKGKFFASTNKRKIIISSIEHSSVYDTCKFLQNYGAEVIELKVDRGGLINISELNSVIDEHTALVSIIGVNNEIGTIQDIKQIGLICERNNVPLHVDATQAVGKIQIDFDNTVGLKYMTFTAHKIYGPKGIGCLVVKENELGLKDSIVPLFHGGEQEGGLRAGTLSNELIVGFGKACEIAKRNFVDNQKKIMVIEKTLINKLKNKFQDKLIINNNFDCRCHDILNIRLIGYRNMVLLNKISPYIAASTGSACSVSKPSRILKAIGLSDKVISESIRLSFSPYLDIRDLDIIDQL